MKLHLKDWGLPFKGSRDVVSRLKCGYKSSDGVPAYNSRVPL